MTNYENYKSEIEPIARMGRKVAIERDTNKIRACDSLTCDKCLFVHSNICDMKALEWADDEYIEPKVDWYKVAVDTPLLVSHDGLIWMKQHFAKYENGFVCAWEGGKTSYTTSTTWYWEYAKLAEVECLVGEQE